MSTNFKKQLIWSFGLFVLIFFSTNTAFDFLSKSFNQISLPKIATVANLTEHNSPVSHHPPSPTQDSSLEKEEIGGHLTVAFVGDIMLDRGVKASVYKNFNGDYAQLFTKIKTQLQSYDILFANLEGPISDKGSDIGGIYSFKMEPEVIPVLEETGFDVLSLTNNHAFNWGIDAYTDTLKRLNEAKITYVGGGFDGPEAYKEKVIEAGGVKVAFLAFSEFPAGGVNSSSTRPGAAIIIEKEIKESISRARQVSDLVVVSYHFGEEYQTEPNDYQRKYAELAIDAGADLIIGHHPHVVQTLEQYKNAYIIYSLGNFIFDQYFSKETMQGGLLEVEVNPESKMIEKATLKKVNLNKFYQVESIE